MKEKTKLTKLKKIAYTGKIKPYRRTQKVMDEELIEILIALENNWYDPEVLKEAIGEKIPINTSNSKRSIFSSGYLKRMSKLTGRKWRQKRAYGENSKIIVKVYSEPFRRKK